VLTPDDRALIAEVTAAEMKATKGPWISEDYSARRGNQPAIRVAGYDNPKRTVGYSVSTDGYVFDSSTRFGGQSYDNAALIALSRNAVPRLLAIIAEQDAEIERRAAPRNCCGTSRRTTRRCGAGPRNACRRRSLC
jgi:hypothetical protein